MRIEREPADHPFGQLVGNVTLAVENVRKRADVYALGALLYAALTGCTPLDACTWDGAAQAHAAGVRAEPLAVPGLPPEVARLCERCLDPVSAARPSAAEAARALRSAVRAPLPATPTAMACSSSLHRRR